MPLYVNPAEYLLEITSTDFAQSGAECQLQLDKLHVDWKTSEAASRTKAAIQEHSQGGKGKLALLSESEAHATIFQVVLALLHRSFIKSYRDVVAYGIRFGMYIGLAIMMGTVWLRLPPTQSSIQPFINAIVSFNFIPKMTIAESIIVLWVRIHVIHGSCLCSGFLGRPCDVHQGACKWLIRRGCIHGCQFPYRHSVSMSVALL